MGDEDYLVAHNYLYIYIMDPQREFVRGLDFRHAK